MSIFNRTLVNLDIINEDMEDELSGLGSLYDSGDSDDYLSLLSQYHQLVSKLEGCIADEIDQQVPGMFQSSHLASLVSSKQFVTVLGRLVGYVLQFYHAQLKYLAILDSEFTPQADRLLNLLQTKAIKAKKQYVTVAKALGEGEYKALLAAVALPKDDWAWHKLTH